MNVDELIEKLKEHSDRGFGLREVFIAIPREMVRVWEEDHS